MIQRTEVRAVARILTPVALEIGAAGLLFVHPYLGIVAVGLVSLAISLVYDRRIRRAEKKAEAAEGTTDEEMALVYGGY